MIDVKNMFGRYGRNGAVEAALSLLVAAATVVPVAVAVGALALVDLFGLVLFVRGLWGSGLGEGLSFLVGLCAVPILVVVGGIFAAVRADRFWPWVTGAVPADPARVDHRDIVATVEAVGRELGVEPRIHLLDVDWLNVAVLGGTAQSPAILLTNALAELPESERRVLVATALTGAAVDGTADRVRLAVRAPAALVVAAARAGLRRVWPLPLFLVLQSFLAALGAGAGWFFSTPFLVGPALVATYGVAVLWLAVLARGSTGFAQRHRAEIDASTVGLVGDAVRWCDGLDAVRRFPAPWGRRRHDFDWLLPLDAHEHDLRTARVLVHAASELETTGSSQPTSV